VSVRFKVDLLDGLSGLAGLAVSFGMEILTAGFLLSSFRRKPESRMQ
jgi:hypothetical protein